jgi:hypothetical protein
MLNTNQAANRMVAQLWTMIDARSIDVGVEPANVISRLVDALDEIDVTYLRRCALPPGVLALAVLTELSPDQYPTGHSERHMVHGKSLSVHRIARQLHP